MDRFIVLILRIYTIAGFYLKSNMDRFIVFSIGGWKIMYYHLKSNMDRFIVPNGLVDTILQAI